jgi:hypothetical protein
LPEDRGVLQQSGQQRPFQNGGISKTGVGIPNPLLRRGFLIGKAEAKFINPGGDYAWLDLSCLQIGKQSV